MISEDHIRWRDQRIAEPEAENARLRAENVERRGASSDGAGVGRGQGALRDARGAQLGDRAEEYPAMLGVYGA